MKNYALFSLAIALFGVAACNDNNNRTSTPAPVRAENYPLPTPAGLPPDLAPPITLPTATPSPAIPAGLPPAPPLPPQTAPQTAPGAPQPPIGSAFPLPPSRPVIPAPLVTPPTTPPRTYKFEADLKFKGFDLTHRTLVRGNISYTFEPNGKDEALKTNHVQCMISRAANKQVFVEIQKGNKQLTIQVQNYTPTQVRYIIPSSESRALPSADGVVMYKIANEVNLLALNDSVNENMNGSRCNVDISIDNGQLHGYIGCRHLIHPDKDEAADLTGTFECAANE